MTDASSQAAGEAEDSAEKPLAVVDGVVHAANIVVDVIKPGSVKTEKIAGGVAKAPAIDAAQIVAVHPADPDEAGKLAFLVLKSGPTFGPAAWFADLTPAEAAPHLKGEAPVLAIPTASQLQRRRR